MTKNDDIQRRHFWQPTNESNKTRCVQTEQQCLHVGAIFYTETASGQDPHVLKTSKWLDSPGPKIG